MNTLTNKQEQAIQTYLFTWDTFEKVKEMKASERLHHSAEELALDAAQDVIEAFSIVGGAETDLAFALIGYAGNPPRTVSAVAAVVGEIASAAKSGDFVDWCERHPETRTAKEWQSYCTRERKAA